MVTGISHSLPLIPKPLLSSSWGPNPSHVKENSADLHLLITIFMPAPVTFKPKMQEFHLALGVVSYFLHATWHRRKGDTVTKHYRDAEATLCYDMGASFLSVT